MKTSLSTLTMVVFLVLFWTVNAHADSIPKQQACAAQPIDMSRSMDLVTLGRDLFYDPILSGNKTVACATCHHPAFGTSDGMSLSIGDGGVGIGPDRRVDPQNVPEQRIPRNAQSLFNLAYPEFSVLFHDGRVERLADGKIRTPLGDIADDGPLAPLVALSMFPVTSPDEMAGHYSENPIAEAVRQGLILGPGGAHDLLANRVAKIPGYRDRFHTIYGAAAPIRYKHLAEALAAFMAHEWRADDSAFDRYLCGNADLPIDALAGMNLFYGDAGCSACHSGRFQTDHGFHAIAMPQLGPGKAERFETHQRDVGRMRVTGEQRDAYKFRTPSLRNVALTAPYGHSGAYTDLRSVVLHHLNPVIAFTDFDRSKLVLPEMAGARDFNVMDSQRETAEILAVNELTRHSLNETEVAQLLAFLNALTDQNGVDGRLGVPKTVPSELPVPNP